MPKDLKIGLACGLFIAVACTIWLATHPSQQTRARIDQTHLGTDRIKPPSITDDISQENSPPAAALPDRVQTDANQAVQPIQTIRFHIVRKGQTLSQIAEQYYGQAGNWPKIVEANKQRIGDPNRLKPGLKLIIP